MSVQWCNPYPPLAWWYPFNATSCELCAPTPFSPTWHVVETCGRWWEQGWCNLCPGHVRDIFPTTSSPFLALFALASGGCRKCFRRGAAGGACASQTAMAPSMRRSPFPKSMVVHDGPTNIPEVDGRNIDICAHLWGHCPLTTPTIIQHLLCERRGC